MKHQHVESSQLRSIAHDGVGRLEARFHCTSCSKGGHGTPDPNCGKCGGHGSAGTYVYEKVPPQVFATLRDAKANGDSVGQTFNKLVKQGGYKFTFTPHEERGA